MPWNIIPISESIEEQECRDKREADGSRPATPPVLQTIRFRNPKNDKDLSNSGVARRHGRKSKADMILAAEDRMCSAALWPSYRIQRAPGPGWRPATEPEALLFGPVPALFRAGANLHRWPTRRRWIVVPVDDSQEPARNQDAMGLAQQSFRLLGMENVEKHRVVHAGRWKPSALAEEISEVDMHIPQSCGCQQSEHSESRPTWEHRPILRQAIRLHQI